VQEEIATVVERAGLVLSKTDMTQLWQALRSMFRYKLTADLNLYVSPTGNDANDGMSSGTAFANPQRAADFIYGNVDQDGKCNVIVHVADGTYNTPGGSAPSTLICSGPLNGPPIQFIGNLATPGNCVIRNTVGSAITVASGAQVSLGGFRVSSTGGTLNYGLQCTNSSRATFHNMDFGPCTSAQMFAERSTIAMDSNTPVAFALSGNAPYCIAAVNHGRITLSGAAVTLASALAFSSAFAQASMCSVIQVDGMTFAGPAATGTRYGATTNSVIYPNLAVYPAFAFPGSVAGAVSSGGQYV
jgi:hypothetical protein